MRKDGASGKVREREEVETKEKGQAREKCEVRFVYLSKLLGQEL